MNMIDSIKILILEDNQNDAELLQHELKKSGLSFSSEIVQTQHEFIAALDNFKPDIILSDYSLPSFDGVTAFHIKQKKHSDIPFIIVSGTIGEENAVELIKNGVTDYALKDKLFTLAPKITRALKDADDIIAKRIVNEKLKIQNEKLFEIAFLQSHQMRVPVVHILGLYNLFNFDNPSDPINAEILGKLKTSAESLDNIIREIVQKTNEIKAIR
ncbi:MAG: response regulator [Flavobacteriaceae bacterium]|nr:response regulator [Flavobacteriaceae bacterium]